MSANTLVIQHVEGSNPCEFRLIRDDHKSAPPVSISSPYEFPIENQPNIQMMTRLRWYLEEFLEYPFPPETNKADAVLDALKSWGTQAFNALFDRRDAPAWLMESEILQVQSDDATILSWPWEALCDPQAGYLAHERRMSGALNGG